MPPNRTEDRMSVRAYLLIVRHAFDGFAVLDVFRPMSESKFVHLLRCPRVHLVRELSQLGVEETNNRREGNWGVSRNINATRFSATPAVRSSSFSAD